MTPSLGLINGGPKVTKDDPNDVQSANTCCGSFGTRSARYGLRTTLCFLCALTTRNFFPCPHVHGRTTAGVSKDAHVRGGSRGRPREGGKVSQGPSVHGGRPAGHRRYGAADRDTLLPRGVTRCTYQNIDVFVRAGNLPLSS